MEVTVDTPHCSAVAPARVSTRLLPGAPLGPLAHAISADFPDVVEQQAYRECSLLARACS